MCMSRRRVGEGLWDTWFWKNWVKALIFVLTGFIVALQRCLRGYHVHPMYILSQPFTSFLLPENKGSKNSAVKSSGASEFLFEFWFRSWKLDLRQIKLSLFEFLSVNCDTRSGSHQLDLLKTSLNELKEQNLGSWFGTSFRSYPERTLVAVAGLPWWRWG